MTDQKGGPKPRPRGESAWAKATAAVAERNREARRAGKERRKAHERRLADSRKIEERRAMSELLESHPTR